MNTGAPWPTLDEAKQRVLSIQIKLHQWSTDDPGRRFDDLFNLVADPAFLTSDAINRLCACARSRTSASHSFSVAFDFVKRPIVSSSRCASGNWPRAR